MMTKEDRTIATRIDEARSIALNADVRNEFNRGLVVAEAYLSGEQYPEFQAPTTHDPYFVINLCADLVDRLVPLIAGGRLVTHIEVQDPEYTKLGRIQERFHVAWQKAVMLREKNLEVARDMIATGLGVARGYVDPYKSIEIGGELGIERIYPSHIWIDPSARDPFDPLLGSKYIGYETAVPASFLMMEHPEFREAIARDVLAPLNPSVVRNENDPIGPILDSLSHTNAIPDKQPSVASDLVRTIEFQWKDYERAEDKSWFEVWKRSLAIGAPDGTVRQILASEIIPYGRPTFVLQSSSVRRNSPYGQGILSRIGDVQDLLNVIISMIMKAGMMSAKVQNVIFTYAEDLDPGARAQIARGEIPAVLVLSGSSRKEGPIQDKVGQMRFQLQNYGAFANLLGQLIGLLEGASGVNAASRGAVSPEKRVSGVALDQLMARSEQARDTQKAHMNAAVTNLGKLGHAMAIYHWASPMVIQGGNALPDYVNQRVPMTIEGSEVVDRLRAQPSTIGPVLMPNAIGIETSQGDYETHPLSADNVEWALGELGTGQAIGADYILNDMGMDVNLSITVEADFMERHQDKVNALMNVARIMPGSVSWETLVSTVMEIYPDFSIEAERDKLDQDELIKQVRIITQNDPQARRQIALMLQQIAAQRAQPQVGAAQSQVGQLGVPATTGVIPEEGTGAG